MTNPYVKENAWLDLTSSWSIKNLERNYETVPEATSASSYELFEWVIMDTAAEDPRTKVNALMVPSYNSLNWQIMRGLGVFTIKDMLKAKADEVESILPKPSKVKKSRNRKQRHAQSKAIVESDSTDSADDKSTKSVGGEGVKNSLKLKQKSFKTELNSITTDSKLLLPEIVENGQTELDEHHRDKLSGATDIQQSSVSNSPDATMKFGISQVQTQLSEFIQHTLSSPQRLIYTKTSRPITRSAAQVMKDLKYTIPNLYPASNVQSTLKEETAKKADDEEKPKAETDDEGFKIPQGTAHRNKKKLEADERRKIVDRILDREIDPSGILVDEVKVRHDLKPYGLNDKEWRCYLIFLKNKSTKNTTLAQVARKLVMELEPKITDVELIRDHEKKSFESQTLKACNLYLKHIKMERYRIQYLVDCLPSNTAKRQREKSASSDSETDTKHQN